MMRTELPAAAHSLNGGMRPEDRIRRLELEQARLLARQEAVTIQLESLRTTLRGLERLLDVRLRRLEQLDRAHLKRGT